jgi:hypothetical protein
MTYHASSSLRTVEDPGDRAKGYDAQPHKNHEVATDGGLDPQEYRRRWQGHVDDLDRLRVHLTDEQVDVLEDCQSQLNKIVTEAAHNLASERNASAHTRRTLQALKQADEEGVRQ